MLLLLVLHGLSACNGTNDGPEGPELIFPRDVRAAGFREVRGCRSPGEHSALAAFTVWVNPEALPVFEAIWADPASMTRMPEGSVVVKELYEGGDCTAENVRSWVVMKKEQGLDPARADWHWQEADRDGTIVVDGPTEECSGCHEGGSTTTCAGYGEQNGFDYLCTVP